MQRKEYCKPRIVTVQFAIESGYYGSVKNQSDQMVLFDFNDSETFPRSFRNDHFSNLGDDNNNYDFFGD